MHVPMQACAYCSHTCMNSVYLSVSIPLLLPDWLPGMAVSAAGYQEPVVVFPVSVENNAKDYLRRRELELNVSSSYYRRSDDIAFIREWVLIVLIFIESWMCNSIFRRRFHGWVVFHVADNGFSADFHV